MISAVTIMALLSNLIQFVLIMWTQRDSAGLTNQNSELKFRLQSMEQQAKLRDGIAALLFVVLQFFSLFCFIDLC